MSHEYDEEESRPTPLRILWEQNYPFGYWDNRIRKINSYNPQDQMEAVFTLLQLADAYVTILSAKLRNPYQPWYMVKEETYKRDIDNTLKMFEAIEEDEDEPYADLSLFDGDPDLVLGVTLHEEFKDKYEPVDFLAADFLGCPVNIDKEDTEIKYLEDRDKYIKMCNGLIDFWRNHYDLLNDLKHGFRLLPFDLETFDSMVEQGYLQGDDVNIEAKRAEYRETEDEFIYFWRLEKGKMPDPEEYEQLEPGEELSTGLHLVVYRIEMQKCVQFARIALRLLHNLFGRGGEFEVIDMLKPLVEEEEQEAIQMFEPFFINEIIYGIES